MKIQKQESEIVVELEGKRLVYDTDEWCDEENLLTDNGVETLEEWKIDLINNYGVGLNELQS